MNRSKAKSPDRIIVAKAFIQQRPLTKAEFKKDVSEGLFSGKLEVAVTIYLVFQSMWVPIPY